MPARRAGEHKDKDLSMSEQNTKSTPTTVTLPVLPLRGLVAFPSVQLNVEIMRPFSLKAFTVAATETDARILLVTQKDVADLLGISQSYISRLEKKIISRLRKEIAKME